MLFSSDEVLHAWAAGLFDGEGTIYCANSKIRISVHMTDLDILETFKENFGGIVEICKKQKEHHKQSWRWTLNAEKAIIFLKKILPFLHSRRAAKANETIKCFEQLVFDRNLKKQKVVVLRQQIKNMSNFAITHEEIAIKLNVSRSYVTHTLNGDYD